MHLTDSPIGACAARRLVHAGDDQAADETEDGTSHAGKGIDNQWVFKHIVVEVERGTLIFRLGRS